MTPRKLNRTQAIVAMLSVVLIASAVVFLMRRGASTEPAATASLALERVERRDLSQTVEASGTVEPLEVVEIKSKASGEVLRMPVEVGSVVAKGDLLALVETVNAQNAYDEATAALAAAQANLQVATSAKKRADELFSQKFIAAEAHETAMLALANARATLVRTQSALENARLALSDTKVRAPIAGTVLSQTVTKGQVISSATSNSTGGTALLRMADLTRVQMRAFVSESDIGSLHAGQTARVSVDAHSDRTFEGKVLKIEPQAVVQQSVTLFAVIVSLDNQEGLLLPGMTGEVVVQVTHRLAVLTVPIDAVRSARDAAALATTLGLDLPAASAGTGAARTPADAAAASTGRRGAANAAPSSGVSRQTKVVFVQTDAGLVMRTVRLGANDYDHYEVLSGLVEGDRVALLGVAQAQAKRANDQAQVRQRMGNMPGAIGRSSTGATPSTGSGNR